MKCLSFVTCYDLSIILTKSICIVLLASFSGNLEPRVGQHEDMPKLLHLLQTMRSWRIDGAEETSSNLSPSTPIITILPSVEEPEKQQKLEKKDEISSKSQVGDNESEHGALVSRTNEFHKSIFEKFSAVITAEILCNSYKELRN